MIQLIAAILVAAPELISEVKALIASIEAGTHSAPITPELIVAMAPLLARLQTKKPV
jgi:ACR3 family arsenite efflux pump ArsB